MSDHSYSSPSRTSKDDNVNLDESIPFDHLTDHEYTDNFSETDNDLLHSKIANQNNNILSIENSEIIDHSENTEIIDHSETTDDNKSNDEPMDIDDRNQLSQSKDELAAGDSVQNQSKGDNSDHSLNACINASDDLCRGDNSEDKMDKETGSSKPDVHESSDTESGTEILDDVLGIITKVYSEKSEAEKVDSNKMEDDNIDGHEKTDNNIDRGKESENQVEDNQNNSQNAGTSPLSQHGGLEDEDVDVEGYNQTKSLDSEANRHDDEDKGIAIDENSIVKPADVYGPGKRSVRSALPKDYLNESDMQDELEKAKGFKYRKKSPANEGATPEQILKERQKKLPVSSKFHNLDLAMVTEPFKHGWQREIVIRNFNGDYRMDRLADIYYFTPGGKKLRSMPQVLEFLEKSGSPLTRDHFTFFKKPIYKPPLEKVRNAGKVGIIHHHRKRKRKDSDSEDIPEDEEPLDKPEIVIDRDTDGTESPLVYTPKSIKQVKMKGRPPRFKTTAKRLVKFGGVGNEPPTKSTAITMVVFPKREQEEIIEPVKPKVLTAEDVLDSPLIMEQMLSKEPEMSSSNVENTDMQIEDNRLVKIIGVPPQSKKFKATARKSTTQKSFRSPFRSSVVSQAGVEALCSLNCPGQENIPPDLHCSVCLCLFHPQCVNFPPDSDNNFICLRCADPDSTMVSASSKHKANKSRATSTLTEMLSKPPISSEPLTDFNNIKIKQEPVDDEELGKPPTSYPVSVNLNSVTLPFIRIPDSVVTTSIATTPRTPKMILRPLYNPPPVSRNDVTGETLGSLRNVLDKRTTASGIPNLPAFVTVSSSPNIPNFHSLNPPKSPVNANPKVVYSASTQLYNAGLTNMPPLPLAKVLNGITSAPPLMSQFAKIPSVVPVTLSTVSTPVTNAVPAGSQAALPRIVNRHSASDTVTTSSSSSMIITSAVSLLPPKLMAAPTTQTSSVVSVSNPSTVTQDSVSVTSSNLQKEFKSGQLLTLPSAVTKRLNLTQPLALRINNMQVTVPPSSFLHTTDGLRVFLPRNTFPVLTGETAKLSVTVTNEKVPLENGIMSVNMNHENPEAVENEKANKRMTSILPSTLKKPGTCKIRSWKSGAINPGMCFMKKLYGGFECLLEIFQYLNLKDLARAGMVCQTWRNITLYPSLWKEVKLKDLTIPDWDLFVRFLKCRSVNNLNLCGLCHVDNPNRTWHQLVAVIHELTNVRQIHFELVPALVLHSICPKMPQLEVLTVRWISDMRLSDNIEDQVWSTPTKLDLAKFSSLSNLHELRVRGVAGLTLPFNSGSSDLESLKNLKILSLTSLKDLDYSEFSFLTKLSQLESLELGDCSSWSSETYFQLGSLRNLKSLRLESGGELPDVGLADALQNMKKLENLELIMYAISDTLAGALEQLENLKTLTVWPDTFNHSAATVNSNTLSMVSKLRLKRLEWGILSNKNASIILDSENNDDSQGPVEQADNILMIPFLPATFNNNEDTQASEMTEYVFVNQFREKLSKLLPDTRLKVFSAKMRSARDELGNHLCSS